MSSKLPQLNNCCGLALETGTKIIGWFELATSYLGAMFYWFALDAMRKDRIHGVEDLEALKIEFLVGFTVCFFNVFLAACLLLGVYQRKPSMVQLWVLCKCFSLICFMVLIFPSLFLNFGPAPIIILNILMFRTYCVLVVNSFYNEIN